MIRKIPIFSIIVPIFCAENTLDACINSVLSQDFDDFELILVDDGSTDNSSVICNYYRDKNPEKIRVIQKENEGPLQARLDGIELAQGKFLMFLDADDKYMSGLLTRMWKTIIKNNADIVIYNSYRCYADNKKELCQPLYDDSTIFQGDSLQILYKDFVETPFLNALWQKCISKDLWDNTENFKKIGRMRTGEDKILSMLALTNAKKIVYVADGLYEYYIYEDSISHKLTAKHYLDMGIVHNYLLAFIRKYSMTTSYEIECLNKIKFGFSCMAALSKKKSKEIDVLFNYIEEDMAFWNAYKVAKRKIPFKIKIICLLLQRKRETLAKIYLKLGLIIKSQFS